MIETNIKINRIIPTDLTITYSAEEIAEFFCSMSEKDQARFFNEIYRIITDEWEAPFAMQLHHIVDCGVLTNDGAYIMKLIGEYAYNV